jgi:hypothetical protein
MSRFGFTTSGSYKSQSPNAAADRCVNWYCETNEDPNGKSPMSLYPSPGLTIFSAGADPSLRGEVEFNGRMFGVGGINFYEILSSGARNNYGTVSNDGSIVSFATGPNQILLASAGVLYVLTLSTNELSTVDPTTYVGPVSQVCYIDGFFVALFKNSGEFQVSSPDDATTWSELDVSIVSVFGDNVVGMIAAYRQIIFFGPKKSVAYADVGAPITPFAVVPGGFIEQGAASTFAISLLDNSVFWMGQDERGRGIAWRANGYTPVRISTFATEFAWQQYATVSDAISYTYQDQGHTFWHVYFPSANKSWRYDAATTLWHEVEFWNDSTGKSTAHRSQCHCFAFGKHLVGDWASGNIYAMSISSYQDFGNPIRRIRQAPHISTEQKYIYHAFLQVDMETGLQPMINGAPVQLYDGLGHKRSPQAFLSWSDDGGHVFGNEYSRDCGQVGQYKKRVYWTRMGRSRDRVYRLTCSDPYPYRIIDSYFEGSPGFQTQERVASQLRKVS